jgi:HlyD family secretion protein
MDNRKSSNGVTGRWPLILVTLGLAVWLSGCASRTAEESGLVVTVQSVRVKKGVIQKKVHAEAVLFPVDQASIVPKVSAPVAKFYVNRGEHVHAGQLLAVLENRDLAASVAENQGTYEEARANYDSTVSSNLPEQIQKAELDVKNAKATLAAAQQLYDGSKKLYDQGALARMQLNQAEVGLTQSQTQLQTAEQQLQKLESVGRKAQSQAAQGQLAAAKGRYDGAQALLAYSEVRSPINGVVTDRPYYAGEMPAAGAALITVMDVSQVIAKAHISQQEAQSLHAGDSATLAVVGVPEEVQGKVTEVSPALDPNSTTVEVWVQAANPKGELKPGTSVRISIIAQTVEDALIVPISAILTGQDGSTSVIVANGDKPEQKSVTTGIREGSTVQITEGLTPGQPVVTVGAYALSQEDPDLLQKTKLKIAAQKGPEEKDAEPDQGEK